MNNKLIRTRRRNSKGASVILVIFAAILLGYLLYLGFQYCLLQGGSREVRNAVDASVLSVSKNVVNVRVAPSPDFRDCGDSSGMVGMSTINRVWGKAYLVNANAEDMMKTGQASGRASAAADQAFSSAANINSNLYRRVTDKITLDSFFANLSEKRQANMLGGDSTIRHSLDDEYPVAMVDRGAESNLTYNPQQLPKNATQIPGVQGYASGYSPFTANGKTFSFTTFRRGEMPHLIADGYFTQNRADSHPLGAMVIPNAFQGRGTADGAQGSLTATASAVANPMRTYSLSIPQGYIALHFSNKCNWYVEGKRKGTIPYGFKPTTEWVAKEVKLQDDRQLNGWGSLGNEYNAASVYGVLLALPADHMPVFQKMLQRLQEIDKNFSLAQLQALLQKQAPNPTVDTYYIFPRYSSSDFTNPTMDIAAKGQALPNWLAVTLAEGQSLPVLKENVQKDQPNKCWDYVFPGTPVTLPHHSEISGTMSWAPGTGYNQCLGELYVDRLTELFFAEKTP